MQSRANDRKLLSQDTVAYLMAADCSAETGNSRFISDQAIIEKRAYHKLVQWYLLPQQGVRAPCRRSYLTFSLGAECGEFTPLGVANAASRCATFSAAETAIWQR